jgi:hypothetical protein
MQQQIQEEFRCPECRVFKEYMQNLPDSQINMLLCLAFAFVFNPEGDDDVPRTHDEVRAEILQHFKNSNCSSEKFSREVAYGMCTPQITRELINGFFCTETEGIPDILGLLVIKHRHKMEMDRARLRLIKRRKVLVQSRILWHLQREMVLGKSAECLVEYLQNEFAIPSTEDMEDGRFPAWTMQILKESSPE